MMPPSFVRLIPLSTYRVNEGMSEEMNEGWLNEWQKGWGLFHCFDENVNSDEKWTQVKMSTRESLRKNEGATLFTSNPKFTKPIHSVTVNEWSNEKWNGCMMQWMIGWIGEWVMERMNEGMSDGGNERYSRCCPCWREPPSLSLSGSLAHWRRRLARCVNRTLPRYRPSETRTVKSRLKWNALCDPGLRLVHTQRNILLSISTDRAKCLPESYVSNKYINP